MDRDMAKNYDPKQVEDRLYQKWLENDYFKAAVSTDKKPYTIVMPPPNITGVLHIGHAYQHAIMDMLIRTKRMQGYNALLLPGTDHASISTEVKVVEKLADEGKTKLEIGRAAFLGEAWAWNEAYGSIITNQIKKIGISSDWSRKRFTLDPMITNAVMEVFVNLYEDGKIYRGEKLINWCPHCKTTISDAEVEHEDQVATFWYISYPLDHKDLHLTFATTRPETMLGDTALAVHPADDRYKAYIGKTVTIPIINRQIPIIADEYVDMKLGTGVVKITPAHDHNDYEMGKRHNLPMISVLDDKGAVNEAGGKYQGLDRFEARKKIVEDFNALGFLVKEEKKENAIGLHERCGTIVEPMLKLQWFMAMETLAKPALEVYLQGDLQIIPKRLGKIYENWLHDIHDWCISRQLWWGHRIPAYYCGDCGNMEVSKKPVMCCNACESSNIRQDEDVLDTWFSSALWPFATMGWPEETADFDYFYPNDVLVTGYEIIFFWVVRMVFSGLAHTKKLPFKDVLLHGLVRDGEGRKFAKSLGNGIDPLDMIEKYGADALRFTLISGTALGNDLRFAENLIEPSRNFLNKIWNATRFILMHDRKDAIYEPTALQDTDKWILSSMNTLIKVVTAHIEKYELNTAVEATYAFIWDEFCDWYIEMVKPRLYNEADTSRDSALWTLKTVLENALKLLHPCMPFITEEIFSYISKEASIMTSTWPTYQETYHFPAEEAAIQRIQHAIKAIRQIRRDMDVHPTRKASLYVVTTDEEIIHSFKEGEEFFYSLGFSDKLIYQENRDGIDEKAISLVLPDVVLYIPFEALIDVEKEKERLQLELTRLQTEINRVDGKLNNKGFTDKAPANIVTAEKEKKAQYESLFRETEKQMDRLV